MLIFGHPYIDSPNFIKINSLNDIKFTKNSDIILLDGIENNLELAKYLKTNSISYAVYINSIKDAIFSNALDANFAICKFDIAKELQNIANEYLWNMKILALIDSDDMLEKVAMHSIDGVIYENYIKGGNNES